MLQQHVAEDILCYNAKILYSLKYFEHFKAF